MAMLPDMRTCAGSGCGAPRGGGVIVAGIAPPSSAAPAGFQDRNRGSDAGPRTCGIACETYIRFACTEGGAESERCGTRQRPSRRARGSARRRGGAGSSAPPRRTSRAPRWRSEEHTSELQSLTKLVCRLLLEKKKKKVRTHRKNRREKK